MAYPLTSAITGGAAPGSAPAPATVRPAAAPRAGSLPKPQPAGPTTLSGVYQQRLSQDPGLRAQLAGINATGSANAAALNEARSRAIAQYGAVPKGLAKQPGGFQVAPETAALANAATAAGTSTTAQLQRAYELAQQHDLASLAARGMIQSGATGQHLGNDLLNYRIQQNTAAQSLMDALNKAQSDYLTQQAGLRTQASTATNQALNRILAEIKAGLIARPAAQPAPVSPYRYKPLP